MRAADAPWGARGLGGGRGRGVRGCQRGRGVLGAAPTSTAPAECQNLSLRACAASSRPSSCGPGVLLEPT
eukprot:3770132-Rhodomonas_salina.1